METALLKRLFSAFIAVAISTGGVQATQAATPRNTFTSVAKVQSATPRQATSADGTVTQTNDVHEQLDSELQYLSKLSADELKNELQSLERKDGATTRVAPLVIVAAIGCAVGIGGAVFTKSWEDPNSAVWALAGVLTSCIPGSQQAKLVKVIVNNKQMIATALKRLEQSALRPRSLAQISFLLRLPLRSRWGLA
ncbi:hypothetical protein [Corynebacterium auriscanis]|uniref:hypothetical protein n=1 Tax=Corynebacterium auriscanis TaxID=99807 RepID=UPI0012EBEA44|nr:hypothetical protein [Corynebacterium auriscanis]WJY72227.1 hypothetical protein CAURIC_02805 [Corynebacterium auriscanis]